MKLLVAFVAICVLMLAVIVWHIVGTGAAVTGVAAGAPPAVGNREPPLPSTAGEPPAAAGAADGDSFAGTAAAVGNDTGSTPPPTRWAEDPAGKAAQQRLAAARAALRDEPNHEIALRDELAALAELGRWSEAAQTLTRLRELCPDDMDLCFEQAAVLLRLRRPVEAVTLLSTVVERQPDSARAWFNLAVAHQSLGHLGDARRAWDRSIDLSPTAQARAQRGVILLDLHEWAAAAADFEAVLQEQPQGVDAVLNLALAQWKLGRGEDARAQLLGLLERQPKHVPALNRLAEMAWTSWQAGPAENAASREEAVKWCRRSLDIDAHQPEVQAWLESALEAERNDR